MSQNRDHSYYGGRKIVMNPKASPCVCGPLAVGVGGPHPGPRDPPCHVVPVTLVLADTCYDWPRFRLAFRKCPFFCFPVLSECLSFYEQSFIDFFSLPLTFPPSKLGLLPQESCSWLKRFLQPKVVDFGNVVHTPTIQIHSEKNPSGF